MGRVITTLINRFDGGISEDKRDGWVNNGDFWTTNKFSITKHFDAFTYPKRLYPHYQTIADEGTADVFKTYKIVKFLYAPYLENGVYEKFVLYGYGVDVANPTKAQIYENHIDTDFTTGWQASTKGTSTVATRNTDVFFYYKNYIYLWAGGNKLCRFHTVEAGSQDDFNNAYQTISYLENDTVTTSLCQPVHHPSDDVAYFFVKNVVYSLNDTTWATALTLPTNLRITCACPFGNFLAIGCVTRGSSDKDSIVFLWDRDSTLATLTSRVSFGKGTLMYLANLNNKLIGVVNYFDNNTISLRKGKIIIKQASGDFAVNLNELASDIQSTLPALNNSVVQDNKLYFPMGSYRNGDARLGIWGVNEYGNLTLDTVENEASPYNGIYKTGNMWWIAHSGDGSINRTDNALLYSLDYPSIYETLIFNAGDSDLTKKLLGVSVTFEKLASGGSLILKYRKDGATSWTTIYTYSTVGGISHSAINIESDGSNLPEYKEIEFRIESYGNSLTAGVAIITGLKFKSEIMDKQLF